MTFKKTSLFRPAGLFLVLAGIGTAALALAPWLDLEQDLGLSWLYQARGPREVPKAVAIISLDQASATQLGLGERPSEWPRSLYAQLVKYLTASEAKVIVFDMTFERPAARAEDDFAFAAAIKDSGIVLVSESLRREAVAVAGSASRPTRLLLEKRGQLIPEIESTVRGQAPFVVPKASRVDSYWAYHPGGWDIPSLPLLAWRVFTAPRADVSAKTVTGAAPATSAPISEPLETGLLNLYGPPLSIETIPLHQVIEAIRSGAGQGSRDVSRFKGKAVFAGFSAISPEEQDRLRDDYRTVFSRADGLNTSGVELAATAFANLVEDRALREVSLPLRLAIVVAWAAVLALACTRLAPPMALLFAAATALAYLLFVYHQFASASLVWPLVIPVLVQMPVAFFIGVWLQYLLSHRERDAVRRVLGYYIPQPMVEQLERADGGLTQPNVVYGSCLATDVSQYVGLAERLDPRQLGPLLNEYFAQLFVPVERSGGTVMDVVGDAMIAVWSAPKADVDVRRRACAAALTIVAAVDRFNMRASGGPTLPTRFGLHSGELLVGNVGASKHYEYRAMGDTVNTASRLQALNKKLGTRLLVSAATLEGLDEFGSRRLGTFILPGKDSALEVFELLDPNELATAAVAAAHRRFGDALALYEGGRLDAAADAFAALLSDCPQEGPSLFYLARCRVLASRESIEPTELTPIRA